MKTTYKYETPEGFKFVHTDEFGDFLFVESAKLPETLNYIKAHGPIQLELNSSWGFLQKDLDFLQEVDYLIEGLAIVEEKLDLRGIENFINLKYLQLSDELAQPIAFEKFPHLVYCAMEWNKHYSESIFPPSLNKISIWSYRPQFGFNETSLHNLRNVTQLKLVQASVENLSLLNHCGPLTKVDIAYGRNLTDISALTVHADSLTHLEIDKCKKIVDFAPLGKLTQLQWLNLCDCKSIPSLSFVKRLPPLDHFVFFGTTVEDGNLSYLKGINHVAFTNKPHYSLKMKDFE